MKRHGDADEGVDLQQGQGVKQPPDPDHDQELCVQLETGNRKGDVLFSKPDVEPRCCPETDLT